MKRLWGKKVSDLSHSSFIDKLMYVASKYGVTIHKIDKWYPSSKTCECGCINKGLSLRDRTWVCPSCGAVNDRDVLAAHTLQFGRAFPNWRVWVIPAVEIPGFHTFVSKNPICFSYGSMSWEYVKPLGLKSSSIQLG